jgi:hypothetical protein
MDFCSTDVFSVNKVGNNENFAAGVIIIAGRSSLCRDKNKHYGTSYVMVYKAMSHVMLAHMRELSPAPALVA